MFRQNSQHGFWGISTVIKNWHQKQKWLYDFTSVAKPLSFLPLPFLPLPFPFPIPFSILPLPIPFWWKWWGEGNLLSQSSTAVGLGLDHAQGVSARRVFVHLVSAQMTRSCAPARPWRGRRGVDLRHCGTCLISSMERAECSKFSIYVEWL